MQNAINAVRVISPLLADQIEQAFNAALAAEREALGAQIKTNVQLRKQLAAERENCPKALNDYIQQRIDTALAAEREKRDEGADELVDQVEAWKAEAERLAKIERKNK
jgi:hypothetical protein